MSICVYCGKVRKLTKEHIWPKSIIRRVDNYTARYSASGDKVFGGELIVKDVCSECNNVLLSVLDSYLLKLYHNYFSNFVDFEQKIVFKFEYEKLLRALLKISYNTVRTTGKNISEFSEFKGFILYGGAIPTNVSLIVELIPPTVQNDTKVFPSSVRAGFVEIKPEIESIILRLVSINSYYFYLLISKKPLTDKTITKINALVSQMSGVCISETSNEVELCLSRRNDTYSIHDDHLTAKSDLYDDFFRKNQK